MGPQYSSSLWGYDDNVWIIALKWVSEWERERETYLLTLLHAHDTWSELGTDQMRFNPTGSYGN